MMKLRMKQHYYQSTITYIDYKYFFNFKKHYSKLSYLLMKRNRKYKKMHRLEITLKYFSIQLERNTIRKELRFTVTLWMNH